MRRLKLLSCGRRLRAFQCHGSFGIMCRIQYSSVNKVDDKTVQNLSNLFPTCLRHRKFIKNGAFMNDETNFRHCSTDCTDSTMHKDSKKPEGKSQRSILDNVPSTSKGPELGSVSKLVATTEDDGRNNIESASNPIENIRGSDVIGLQQHSGKNGGTKRIIKVVPTATKISEMSGGVDVVHSRQSSKLITALRAMNEYCLDERHLEKLPRFERRSAYFGEMPTIMYTEADVERLAIQVHGSKAKQRRLSYQAVLMLPSKSVFGLGGEAEQKASMQFKSKERLWEEKRLKRESLLSGSGLVVLLAVGVNAANAALKFVAWCYTGSHSMFAEGVHSLADTLNQIVLAIGIHQSIKKPDTVHPYGYSNLRHVTSLISGVGIFFLGTGLSVYNGIHGLMYPQELHSMFWSFVLLGGSFLSDGATLLFAYHNIRKKAQEHHMSVKQYVWASQEPGLNVVLLEDCASVIGVSIAAASIAASQILKSTVPDAIGSLAIGSLLGVVASFIIYINSAHLVGKSMPQDEAVEIIRELENDSIVRSVQDVKTTELGGDQIRFKAEVDLDGYQMTKAYLKTQDLPKILEEVQSFDKTADLEKFLLFHGEQIVDRVGAEIDRIEQDLKQKHPDLRHVDLEVL